jgi:hypothetical protein
MVENPKSPNSRTRLPSWLEAIGQVEVLLSDATKTLEQFYVPRDGGFRSGNRRERPWTLSHALCVEASLHATKRSGLPFVADRARKLQLKILVEQAWQIKNRPEPYDYPYTASVAIPALTDLIALRKAKITAAAARRVRGGCEAIIDRAEQISKGLLERPSWSHAMFVYRMRRALRIITDHWTEPLSRIGFKRRERKAMTDASQMMGRFATSQLYYFLSMCSAVPDNEENALSLGYLIHTLDEFDDFKNDVIIAHSIRLAIATLFRNGFPRVQTIVNNEVEQINISASPLELLTLLARSRTVQSSFHEFCEAYESAFNSLLATRRCVNGYAVWMAEPWRGVEKPEAWVIALVIEFLASYKQLLKSACAPIIETALKASREPPRVKWRELADSGWRDQLQDEFLEPIKTKYNKERLPIPVCSLLLFGPPGTAKTSIAKAIAHELDWPFIAIAPDQFAEDGLDSVIRFGRQLFQQLMLIERCVVLFDEVDELVVTREANDTEKIGRFITTSMLPWFQELHDQGRIIFIATTNFIEHFDPAVRRPGRFDFVTPVGPPSNKERRRILRELFGRRKLPPAQITILVGLFERCVRQTGKRLDGPWQPTIGELLRIADAILTIWNKKESTKARKEAIAKMVNDFGKHPQIPKSQLMKLEEDTRKYRYPFAPDDRG